MKQMKFQGNVEKKVSVCLRMGLGKKAFFSFRHPHTLTRLFSTIFHPRLG